LVRQDLLQRPPVASESLVSAVTRRWTDPSRLGYDWNIRRQFAQALRPPSPGNRAKSLVVVDLKVVGRGTRTPRSSASPG
jgi:hypothetical protein